jgi:hypothetical protein
MTDSELAAAIAAAPWKASQHVSPHEYLVEGWPGVATLVAELRRRLARDGYDASFKGYRRTFRYLRVGEYAYWSMPPVLNRCRAALAPPPPEDP